ncbi:hypothetical protein H5185_04960 [Shewanella sp. SG44-6]|uniref:hypothetical protein n=1 Tax=Shewanella sp. SG44-6 TaxID=2760959 RepID=UPI0015FFAAB5|nr:hypothetical protein [Shewanella sp. SG44-6]MBB1388774.1 hypothetical protein [Shewanella sp. SG44-6]
MSAIVNLALLESLKAHDFKDEIDLYIPFLANTILEIEAYPFDVPSLANKFKEKFGFKPPEAVVKVLLVRAKKNKLVKIENHLYVPISENLTPFREQYEKNKAHLEDALASVIFDFIEFTNSTFDKIITAEYAENILLTFIENNVASLISKKAVSKRDSKNNIKNESHLVASYIAHLYQKNSRDWEEVQTVIKGVVLANYLFFADTKAKVSAKKTYCNISVYLDTPLIVALLGYNGNLSKNAIQELLQLLQSLEVNVYIFDKTLKETEGLFEAWKRDLKRGSADNFNPATLHLLLSRNIDIPQLETQQALLEKNLAGLGINVKYGWRINPEHQCDEKELESHLKRMRAVSSTSKQSIEHDVICISRVNNSRAGVVTKSLNDNFSVFVTPNASLIKHANRFFSSDIDSGIPIVISDTWLTTIFWLKHQNNYKDLPTHSLVSHAYATLNKSDSVWDNFLSRFKRLNAEGVIDDETVEIVRYHKSLLKEVNDCSIEVGDDFSDEGVLEIVKRIEAQKEEAKNLAVASAITLEQEKLSTVISKLSKSDETVIKFESFIDKSSRTLSLIVTAILGSSLILGFYGSLKGLDVFNGETNFILGLATIIMFSLNILGTFWGINLITIYKKLSEKLSKWWKNKILNEQNSSTSLDPFIDEEKP